MNLLFFASLALILIGVALLIALPFCRKADDDIDHAKDTVTVDTEWLQSTTYPPTFTNTFYPTPLECAVARVQMGEPIASAARNEGIEMKELMDELRKCQATN